MLSIARLIKINYFIIVFTSFLSQVAYADTWYCEAKCSLLVKPGYPEHLGLIKKFGKGQGNTRNEAKVNAIKDAKTNLPEGTIPKHCQEFDCFSRKR